MDLISLSPRQPTVQQTVLENPARARVFEKHGIGYCCHGGGRTLETACRDSATEPATLQLELRELDELSARRKTGLPWGELSFNEELRAGHIPDWAAAPLHEVAAHVVSVHHESLRSELPRLTRLVNGIVSRHGAAHHGMGEVQFVLQRLRACLETHMAREESELAALSETDSAGSPALSTVLRKEHDLIAESLTRLRRLTNGFAVPQGACVTFRVAMDALADFDADITHHIHEENEMLFARLGGSG